MSKGSTSACLGAFAKLRYATVSLVVILHPRATTRLLPDGVSWKLIFAHFLENLWNRIRYHYNLTRMTGTLHGDSYTCVITYRCGLLKMRNFHDKFVEKIKTHILFSIKTFFSKFDICRTVHHFDNWRIKNQLDATYYFIVLLIGSTCFGHYYAHHQELATVMLITTLVVSFLVCCRLEVRCG